MVIPLAFKYPQNYLPERRNPIHTSPEREQELRYSFQSVDFPRKQQIKFANCWVQVTDDDAAINE